jgi:hypothetical protein
MMQSLNMMHIVSLPVKDLYEEREVFCVELLLLNSVLNSTLQIGKIIYKAPCDIEDVVKRFDNHLQTNRFYTVISKKKKQLQVYFLLVLIFLTHHSSCTKYDDVTHQLRLR